MDGEQKKCPLCAEQIPATAEVCPYCGTRLVKNPSPASPPTIIENPVKVIKTPPPVVKIEPLPTKIAPISPPRQRKPWLLALIPVGMLFIAAAIFLVLLLTGNPTVTGWFVTPTSAPLSSFLPAYTATPSPTATPAVPPPEIAALSWELLSGSANMKPAAFTAIAVDLGDSDHVLAGTYGAGIYASLDGGTSWSPSNNGLGSGIVDRIVFDQQNPRVIYTSFSNTGGIYKSTDGGENWFPIMDGIEDLGWVWDGHIIVDPSDGQRLFFVATSSTIYNSTDGGEHWQSLSRPCNDAIDIAIDPANGNHLYAAIGGKADSGCAGGIYESTDGGGTWDQRLTEEIADARPEDWIGWNMAIDPADLNSLYAFAWGQLYHSMDGGDTWTNLPSISCDWMTISDGVAYCGKDTRIYVSRDAGSTWTTISCGLNQNCGDGAFTGVPGTPVLYAGETILQRSEDGGRHWTALPQMGMARMRLVVDPRNSDRLYLGGFPFGLEGNCNAYRSDNGGLRWQAILTNASRCLIAIDPTAGVIYHTSSSAIYRSSDLGASWARIDQNFGASGSSPVQVAPRPENPTQFWVVPVCGPLFLSIDYGRTYTPVEGFQNACQNILFTSLDGQYNFEIGGNQGYRSSDRGESWSEVSAPGGTFQAGVIHPSPSENTAYVGSTYRGVLKTTDGGQSWVEVNGGMGAVTVNDLAIDTEDGNVVYAATGLGLFITVDGGNWWWRINTGLGANSIAYSLAIDPSDPTKIYAVTPDGIYRLVTP